jgi:hypothetical protein
MFITTAARTLNTVYQSFTHSREKRTFIQSAIYRLHPSLSVLLILILIYLLVAALVTMISLYHTTL